MEKTKAICLLKACFSLLVTWLWNSKKWKIWFFWKKLLKKVLLVLYCLLASYFLRKFSNPCFWSFEQYFWIISWKYLSCYTLLHTEKIQKLDNGVKVFCILLFQAKFNTFLHFGIWFNDNISFVYINVGEARFAWKFWQLWAKCLFFKYLNRFLKLGKVWLIFETL